MNLPKPLLKIGRREVSEKQPPLIIAEIGINHAGSVDKAIQMIDDVADAGGECVKFQCHILRDEMIPNEVIPGNSDKTIWQIISEATLSEKEEEQLKRYVEQKNLIYLCTPFSRAAAKRLEEMSVSAFKIGSGECNNLPLIDYICGFKKPIVLSTGMNDLSSIKRSASKIRDSGNPLALLHCTSMYPTPYSEVRLPAITTLKREVPYAVVGISDHSLDIYTSLGAVALGASIIEKHFTSDKSWEGPDIPISIDKNELKSLIEGSFAIHEASCGNVGKLPGEAPTIRFAYASVVSTRRIEKGEELSTENVWVKRPGTGAFRAEDYEQVLGRKATRMILPDSQIEEGMLAEDDK